MYIMESDSKGKRYTNPTIKFIKNGNQEFFSAESARDLFKKIIDWLYKDGYEFSGSFHNNPTRKLMTISDVKNKINSSKYSQKDFHKIQGTQFYIMCATPVKQMFGELVRMLELNGVESIQISGLDKSDEFGQTTSKEGEDYTFIKAAKSVLAKNGNKPMSANEIWQEIEKLELIDSSGATPLATLNAKLLAASDNSNARFKLKNKFFTITSTDPNKFKLIDYIDSENFDVIPFSKFGLPQDYKATQAQDELEKQELRQNPFKQAICVLGSPSAGKSTTVRKVLRNENHKFDIWEPTAVTTNLLAQFDSQEGYVPSRLGELLIEANENPNRCYTMVLDEFHKSNIIEMVNDELKHAISLKRYEGDRFISIDRPFRYLKQHLEVDDAGNVKVPDNFGFIFISSKPNVIANNRDIWDRLDIVNLTVENREGISTAEDLKKLVISETEKLKMVSQRND